MMTRTDTHRPSEIVPADYTFLFGYAHPTTVDDWPVPGFNINLLVATRTGKPFETQEGTADPIVDKQTGKPIPFAKIHKNGPCDVCGAWHIEGSVFFHVPTREAVALGWQCAEKLELAYDESERALISGNRKAARAAIVAKIQRKAFLKSFVESERKAADGILGALRLDHHITKDIRRRIIKGNEPSQKQRELLFKLVKQQQKQKEEKEEIKVPVPVASGRQTVEGIVVSVKTTDYGYGPQSKMTIKVETPDGVWLTWGTRPDSLYHDDIGGLKGATVRFDAKLTVSDKDPSFSFFKRPTKCSILKAGPQAAENLARIREDIADIIDRGEEEKYGDWLAKCKDREASLISLGVA